MTGALCEQERTELIDIHSRFRATLDALAALRGQLAQACSKSHSAAPALCVDTQRFASYPGDG
jgi:hypothetical protein